jgi:hypothetical protein
MYDFSHRKKAGAVATGSGLLSFFNIICNYRTFSQSDALPLLQQIRQCQNLSGREKYSSQLFYNDMSSIG